MESDARQVGDDIIQDGVEGQPGPSALDRPLTLPLSPAVIISAVAILAAAALRLPDLTRWALNPAEGSLALAARDLVRGNSLPDAMLGKPFVVEWIALFMFLGDTIVSAGRVALAVAGIIGIIGLLGLRREFGNASTIAAMLLLAFSPTLVSASRSMDGGILLFTVSVLLFACLSRAVDVPGVLYPSLTGLVLALLLLSGPLGLPAVLIVAVGFVLLREEVTVPAASRWLNAGIAFVISFVILCSALLTQPASMIDAPAESISLLWEDHISEIGSGFHLVFWNLIINEPLLLLLAILGAVFARESSRVRSLGAWSVVALVIISLLGDAGPGGFALTLLPLGLLAGEGAIALLGRLQPSKEQLVWAGIFVAGILALGFGFISLVGLAEPVEGRSTSETVVRFLLITVVVVIPVGLMIARFSDRMANQRLLLIALTAAGVLAALTLRSATLSASEWPGQPGNLLSAGAMGDDIPVVIDRIKRISRDLTRTERDARMPVGGVGLRIALDERAEQPFAWYFREYPNLTVYDPASEALPEGTQLVILDGSRDAETLAPGLAGTSYVLQFEDPDYVESPDWGELASGLFSLDGWRQFGAFVLNRETSEPVPAGEFRLHAIPVIAERFTVDSGPYRLDDRAGIGDAAGQFNQPRGVAIDANGGVYVVDGGNTRIQHFDPAGAFDQFIGEGALAQFPGGAGGAGGLVLDSDGNLYVADTWNHQIKVFAPSGELLRSWGSFFDSQDDPAQAASQPGGFYGPRALAIHDGLIYVTDTGNERVQVFTLEGEFVRVFGQIGSETGQLIEPVGIAVTADGVVLVADSHNARIARFSLEGEPLDPWPVDLWEGQQFFEPYIAVGPDGRVHASDSVNAQIAVFDADGQSLPPITDPSLLRPYDMAISSDGLRMLVSDGLANAVITISLQPAG